jgi:hypothetical protein
MIRALTINWRTGQFQWTPAFSDSVSGSASAFWPRPRDPFSFRILDDNDVLLLEDTPIEITSSILEGTGASTAWEEGRLTFTNVMAGEFHVSVNSQYLSSTDTGRADLIVTNGVITTSYDDGIFNGLLPPVGYPGTFDVAFPYSITATYDYPALGANMELEFGGASANTVPEPGTIGLMIVGSLMFLRRHNR